MAQKYYNATELVNSVLTRAMLPNTNETITTEDILRFANEEIDNSIVPYIMQFHEDYFLTYEKTPVVSGQGVYPIPYRAMGNKLNDLSFEDIDGSVYEMTRTLLADEYSFKSNYYNPYGRYFLRHFYVQGDEVVIASKESDIVGGGFLKFAFYLRPNLMVEETRYSTIKTITPGVSTTVIELNIYPDNFPQNSVSESKMDFIKGKTPFKTLDYDIDLVAIDPTGKTITVNNTDVPIRLAIGDFVCLAEEAPYAQIPEELNSILAQRVACRCLEAIGDTQGLTNAMAKLQEMESKGGSFLDSRVESAPLKVVNKHGFLQYRRRTPYGGI